MYNYNPDDPLRFARHVGIDTVLRGKELIFQKCPYCGGLSNDKHTFSINVNTGQFQCFRESCLAKGNMITLAKDFDFKLKENTNSPYNGCKTTSKTTHQNNKGNYKQLQQVKPESAKEAIEYMATRGISADTVRDYNITVQTDNVNIIVFPFYDQDGVLRYVKYRNTQYNENGGAKEWCETGGMPILFGMNHCEASHNHTLVITEGQHDALALAEAGVANVVSVPNGAKGFTWIDNCREFLAQFDTLIVFGDNEKGHITLLDKMKKEFIGQIRHVCPVDYQECKDANELLLKHGKEAVAEAVANAKLIDHPMFTNLADVEVINVASMERLNTGVASLDALIGGLFFGQLVVVTGSRGDGKSTLVSQLVGRAVEAGYNTYVYSGEMSNEQFCYGFGLQVAGPEHINMLEVENGSKVASVDGQYIDSIRAWYNEKVLVLDSRQIAIYGGEDTLTDLLEMSIRNYGCKVIVVDNLMTALYGNYDKDLYSQQNEFMQKLMRLAKGYNVLILVVAHPKKNQNGRFDLDEISGSGNIGNLADIVIRYARPYPHIDNGPDRLIQVYKERNFGHINERGIGVYYDERSRRISENKEFNWDMGWESDTQESNDVLGDPDLPFDS